MMKKEYIAPQVEIVKTNGRPVLYTASPGVGSDYNGGDIEAKKMDLNIEFHDLWEE